MDASAFEVAVAIVAGTVTVLIAAIEPADLARALRRLAGREGGR